MTRLLPALAGIALAAFLFALGVQAVLDHAFTFTLGGGWK